MEPTLIAADRARHLDLETDETDFFFGGESVRSTVRPGMVRWRELLCTLMSRNASDVVGAVHLPVDRLVENGGRVEIWRGAARCQTTSLVTSPTRVASAVPSAPGRTRSDSGRPASVGPVVWRWHATVPPPSTGV